MKTYDDPSFAAQIRHELEDELALPPTMPRAARAPSNPTMTFCPACAATQALLASKQVQVVDLETRLHRAEVSRDKLRARIDDLRQVLKAARAETAEVRAELAAHHEDADALLAQLHDAGILRDETEEPTEEEGEEE
jgi:septal ring factor EnvC (AmiA/AmiB activator)